MKQNSKLTYRNKVERLGKHVYDRDSKSFHEGAWKNLTAHAREVNREALRRVALRAFS